MFISMAPIALKKLTALQMSRTAEIESTRVRLVAKPRDSLDKTVVQARLDSVREIWAEIRRIHSEIIVRDDTDTDAYVPDKWFDRIKDVFENAEEDFLLLLAFFNKSVVDVSFSEAGSESSRVAKLPKIPLPKFSGKEEDWASFCDLFTTLVHNITGLSDAIKLQYLKSCLTDEAAEQIKDVKTIDGNYASTWKALKDRYGNP